MPPTPLRPTSTGPLEKIAVAAVATLALAAGTTGGPIGAAPSARPLVTVRASYSPALHNILFQGFLLPASGQMLATVSFRLLAGSPGTWHATTGWMALITGVHARWSPNGRYTGGLMQMNAPVAPGTYRVELRAVDDDGGTMYAESNTVRVP